MVILERLGMYVFINLEFAEQLELGRYGLGVLIRGPKRRAE